MDTTTVSALAALGGSLIGGMTTLATTWHTQRYGMRSQRLREEINKREALYAQFIDEASERVIDALEHEISEARQVVRFYSLFCRIQLVCSEPVLAAAERVLKTTAQLYLTQGITLRQLMQATQGAEDKSGSDAIAQFSRACREELEALQRRV